MPDERWSTLFSELLQFADSPCSLVAANMMEVIGDKDEHRAFTMWSSDLTLGAYLGVSHSHAAFARLLMAAKDTRSLPTHPTEVFTHNGVYILALWRMFGEARNRFTMMSPAVLSMLDRYGAPTSVIPAPLFKAVNALEKAVADAGAVRGLITSLRGASFMIPYFETLYQLAIRRNTTARQTHAILSVLDESEYILMAKLLSNFVGMLLYGASLEYLSGLYPHESGDFISLLNF